MGFFLKITKECWFLRKADADTVQYGATPPPVPVSQTLIGLGFLYFSVGFEIEIYAKTSDRHYEITGF